MLCPQGVEQESGVEHEALVLGVRSQELDGERKRRINERRGHRCRWWRIAFTGSIADRQRGQGRRLRDAGGRVDPFEDAEVGEARVEGNLCGAQQREILGELGGRQGVSPVRDAMKVGVSSTLRYP